VSVTQTVTLHTSVGDIRINLFGNHAPKTVRNFVELAEGNREWTHPGTGAKTTDPLYNGTVFHRVISGFMVQFGINGDPTIMARWRGAQIGDDQVTQSNKRGMITFAMAGPNTRTSQVFINFNDNSQLDQSGFAPFGRVLSGMNVVDAINAEYGEGAPRGRGPDQSRLQNEGNAYLAKDFPRLDYIKKATIER